MSRAIAYKCKTPGCDSWLKMRDVPDDTLRRVTVPLHLGDPRKITCPACKQEHEYLPSEEELVKIKEG
jgi:hypothetical protein